jgi:hypothetical protein
MTDNLSLWALGLLGLGTLLAFFTAASVLRLSSAKELTLTSGNLIRSPSVWIGIAGLLCVVLSASLYQVSVSTSVPLALFDCALGRPYAPTTISCTSRGGDQDKVSWSVSHESSVIFRGIGINMNVGVSAPGNYEVESVVTRRRVFLERSGSSKVTIKVDAQPPPQVQTRSIPFSISLYGNKTIEQTFNAEPQEKILNASVQIHSSLPAVAKIVSQTDQRVVVQVISNIPCIPSPFGASCRDVAEGRVEGQLLLTVTREVR